MRCNADHLGGFAATHQVHSRLAELFQQDLFQVQSLLIFNGSQIAPLHIKDQEQVSRIVRQNVAQRLNNRCIFFFGAGGLLLERTRRLNLRRTGLRRFCRTRQIHQRGTGGFRFRRTGNGFFGGAGHFRKRMRGIRHLKIGYIKFSLTLLKFN